MHCSNVNQSVLILNNHRGYRDLQYKPSELLLSSGTYQQRENQVVHTTDAEQAFCVD